MSISPHVKQKVKNAIFTPCIIFIKRFLWVIGTPRVGCGVLLSCYDQYRRLPLCHTIEDIPVCGNLYKFHNPTYQFHPAHLARIGRYGKHKHIHDSHNQYQDSNWVCLYSKYTFLNVCIAADAGVQGSWDLPPKSIINNVI